MKKTIFTAILLLLTVNAVAADQVQPSSTCEALAVSKSRPVAEKSAGADPLDLVSISYIGANKEFNLEFSNNEESVVIQTFVTSGSREASCTLSKPKQLNND